MYNNYCNNLLKVSFWMTRTWQLTSPLTFVLELEEQACKMQLVTFPHQRADPKFSEIMMNGCSLKEVPCLKRLLELELFPDHKWNSYIWSLGSVHCTNLVSIWLCHLYCIITRAKSHQKMEYYCHILPGVAQSSLVCPDRVQKCLRGLVDE